MLHNIQARNFLSIQQADVHMTRLNLIVGPNSSGKSALLKALRALTTHWSAQGRGRYQNGSDDSVFVFPLQGGVAASFSQVLNDSKRRNRDITAPIPTIDLSAVVSSDDGVVLTWDRGGVRENHATSGGYVSVGYQIERVVASETPRIASHTYSFQAFDPFRAHSSQEEYWDDEEFESATRPDIYWDPPYLERSFHPIEVESSRNTESAREVAQWLGSGTETPLWRWTEQIHRIPDVDGVFSSERPILFQIVMSDNSDIEWFGELQISEPMMVPHRKVDPVTGLIEGVMIALSQLRASRKLVGSSLAHYALDGRADDIDDEGLPSDFSLNQPLSENTIRLGTEVIEEIADGQTHGLPRFLWEATFGRPVGFGESALNALLDNFQGQTPNHSDLQDAIDSAVGVASETVLSLILRIFEDPGFRKYLLATESAAMSESSSSDDRNPKNVYLAAFKYEPFFAAVARAIDDFEGSIADRALALSCVSMLSIAAPHRLRGEVWRRIESEQVDIPAIYFAMGLSEVDSSKIQSKNYLPASLYLKYVGRVGSDKTMNFAHRNFSSEEASGATDERFRFSAPPARELPDISLGIASDSVKRWATNVAHIEALRLPSPFSPIDEDRRVSPDGANSIQLIERYGKTKVALSPLPPGARSNRKRADQNDRDLNTCLGVWLKHLGLISRFRQRPVNYGGNRLFVKTPHAEKLHDLSQVGSGVAQVLPILLAPLLIDPGETVVLEEPEAHLHPAAQMALADFLVACAASGRQIITETHSEHIVNRVRRRIAEGHLSGLDAQMLGVEVGEEGTTYVPNAFAEDGSFLGEWPKGFLGVSLDEAIEFSKLRRLMPE